MASLKTPSRALRIPPSPPREMPDLSIWTSQAFLNEIRPCGRVKSLHGELPPRGCGLVRGENDGMGIAKREKNI